MRATFIHSQILSSSLISVFHIPFASCPILYLNTSHILPGQSQLYNASLIHQELKDMFS